MAQHWLKGWHVTSTLHPISEGVVVLGQAKYFHVVVLPLELVDDGVGLGVTTSPLVILKGVSGVMVVNSSTIKVTASHLAKVSEWQSGSIAYQGT